MTKKEKRAEARRDNGFEKRKSLYLPTKELTNHGMNFSASMKKKMREKILPTSYGFRITPEKYGILPDYSFDWTGKGWAIQSKGMRFTHRGDWIYSPQPSRRTPSFFSRTLWTFEEGMEKFKKLLETED